jgi:hypothetical protein
MLELPGQNPLLCAIEWRSARRAQGLIGDSGGVDAYIVAFSGSLELLLAFEQAENIIEATQSAKSGKYIIFAHPRSSISCIVFLRISSAQWWKVPRKMYSTINSKA